MFESLSQTLSPFRKCQCCGGRVDDRLEYAEWHRKMAVEQRAEVILEHSEDTARHNREMKKLRLMLAESLKRNVHGA